MLERRSNPRVPVRFTLRCRRLDRAGFDEFVEAVDLSPSGARIRCKGGLHEGDVVLTTFLSVAGDDVGLKGTVVRASLNDQFAQVAFVDVSARSGALLDAVLSLHDASRWSRRQPSTLVVDPVP
jgi:hypothetical protein